VPAILRAADLRLETLAEKYGVPRDQEVDDVTWIGYTAANGRVAFMKDSAIADRGSLEAAAVRSTGARCFTLLRQDLPAHRMAGWFLNRLDDITAACAQPGPFIYAVRETDLRQLLP
jgi:hypothetical protein